MLLLARSRSPASKMVVSGLTASHLLRFSRFSYTCIGANFHRLKVHKPPNNSRWTHGGSRARQQHHRQLATTPRPSSAAAAAAASKPPHIQQIQGAITPTAADQVQAPHSGAIARLQAARAARLAAEHAAATAAAAEAEAAAAAAAEAAVPEPASEQQQQQQQQQPSRAGSRYACCCLISRRLGQSFGAEWCCPVGR
jgi:hypothetical protein